jgi:acetyl-CoA C-acetyltransferase
MGMIAENLALKYGISREEQDAFAQHSQEKARAAVQNGRFQDEIVPITLNSRKTPLVFRQDEHPRFDSTLDGLANLKPAFKQNGSVTAGNASGINDGAAALLLTTREQAEKYGLKPMASIKSWAMIGLEPEMMGLGPVQASKNALRRAKLMLNDIDLIECNEAFAVQCLAVSKDLDINMEKLNVNGGAIALGHPIGVSGTRIAVTLSHELNKRELRYGLATLCIGGGMGAALIIENEIG